MRTGLFGGKKLIPLKTNAMKHPHRVAVLGCEQHVSAQVSVIQNLIIRDN